MAIHNSVFLFGRVLRTPNCSYNEDGEMIKVMLALTVLSNRERKYDASNKVSFITLFVMTQNKNLMKIMKDLNPNDVVQLKGTFCTRDCQKASVCSECGKKNKVNGTISFVNPIYLKVVKTGNTKEEAIKLLRESQEISNIATIIGNVCTKPETFKNTKGETTTQYQLAIDRKYRIKEDSPLVRTDYPWVRSFDTAAEMDAICLQVSSTVFIDGFLQSRSFERKSVCSNEDCKATYIWNDQTLEIIPYQTEYLNNFVTPEEKEKEDKKKLEQTLSDLFSEE